MTSCHEVAPSVLVMGGRHIGRGETVTDPKADLGIARSSNPRNAAIHRQHGDALSAGVATVGSVNSNSADQRNSLVLAGLLLVAGVLAGLSPLLGVVVTADASPTTAATIAAFVAVLPGVLAVVLAARRPLLGLAATAGAGVIGVVRLLTDIAVVTEADRITRPELFAETTDRARPFTAAAGGWLLVAADVLWLAIGVLAAMRTAAAMSEFGEPRSDAIFGGIGAESDSPDPDPEITDDDRTTLAAALSEPQPGRRPLNLPMVSVGFVGAVLLMVGALGTPYSGGYLALRVLPFGSSLTGLLAAALLGFLAAVIVVVAGALPRAVAQALLARHCAGRSGPRHHRGRRRAGRSADIAVPGGLVRAGGFSDHGSRRVVGAQRSWAGSEPGAGRRPAAALVDRRNRSACAAGRRGAGRGVADSPAVPGRRRAGRDCRRGPGAGRPSAVGRGHSVGHCRSAGPDPAGRRRGASGRGGGLGGRRLRIRPGALGAVPSARHRR